MKHGFLIKYIIVLGLSVIVLAGLFVIQSACPIRSIPSEVGKNGGMQYELDTPIPINNTTNSGGLNRAYDELVKGEDMLKTSTGGHNVIITNISTGYYTIGASTIPVYIFSGYFNDTKNKEQYTAYIKAA